MSAATGGRRHQGKVPCSGPNRKVNVDEYIESLRQFLAETDEDYKEMVELLGGDLADKGLRISSYDDLRLLVCGGDAVAAMLINFLGKTGEGPLLTGLMNKMVDGYLAGFVATYDQKENDEATD